MISEAEKDKLKNKRELNRILWTLPKDRKSIGARLVDELIFMTEMLASLKAEILKNGTVDNFKQGKQQFKRESPAVKTYGMIVQRYSLLYRQLTDLMPKPLFSKSTEDKLLKFMEEFSKP